MRPRWPTDPGAHWRRLSWPLRHRLGRHGPLALALLALGFGLAGWHAVRREALDGAVQQLQQQARALRERSATPAAAASAEASLRQLPALRQHVADLRVLFELADAHRLRLARSEHQLHAPPEAALVSVAATVPLEGSYAQLKAFMHELLQRLPHVALEDLRLERPDIGSATLQARLRLNFHYQRAEP